MSTPLRIGLIGAGGNTKTRHIPGLRAVPDVDIVAVCNRRPESTAEVARTYSIPRTYERWQDLLADSDIDAVVIGTWPYLHCPITLAALEAGKHVLTEARLSMNAAEAHQMLEAARQHPRLVTQVVPSPFGLKGHRIMVERIEAGFLGEVREVQVCHLGPALADPTLPLSWRQDADLSGVNMLTLGILHETLLRWQPSPVRVLAQVHAFIPSRIDPTSGVRRPVGTPDSVQVLAVLENGARASYHFSGVSPFGQQASIALHGSEGVLIYDLLTDRIRGQSRSAGVAGCSIEQLPEIPIPREKESGWQVEADFVRSIREGAPVNFTNFETGVAYMEFTEAVARSAQHGLAIELPLQRNEPGT
jgi:predicted dehydrogenase